jgi:hypothetical protein
MCQSYQGTRVVVFNKGTRIKEPPSPPPFLKAQPLNPHKKFLKKFQI